MREQIDLTDPDRFSNGVPHHWFAWMRANEPVYWQEESDGPGFWSVLILPPARARRTA